MVKLFGAGCCLSHALKRLGYDDEITAIRIGRRTEALDRAGVQFNGLLR